MCFNVFVYESKHCFGSLHLHCSSSRDLWVSVCVICAVTKSTVCSGHLNKSIYSFAFILYEVFILFSRVDVSTEILFFVLFS